MMMCGVLVCDHEQLELAGYNYYSNRLDVEGNGP
jgi:hypothetical protein